MSEKTHTPQEVRAELAKVIKSKVEAFADHVKTLRAKELSKSEAKGGKLSKAELCPLCGNPDRPGTCICLRKNAVAGYGPNGEDLSKKTPPGISEETMHKLKREYKGDKSKAYATAWAIENKTVKKAMPSSSAAALAPKPPKVATPIAQVNQELGGFKSVVKKGEGSPASPSYGANVDPADKAGMPKAGKDIPEEGSGGKVTKGKNLAKAAVPAKAAAPAGAVPQKPKAVVGVPGKQPVGEGGGDAFKTSVGQANKEMAGFKSIASNPTAMPAAGVHPATAAGLKDVKSLSPNAQSAASWKGQGLPGLLNRLKSVQAPKPAPGAAWKGQGLPGLLGRLKSVQAAKLAPGQGLLTSKRFHGALPLQRSEHDTKEKMDTLFGADPKVLHPSDKKAKPVKKAEPLMKKPAHGLGNCALCSKEEHSGMCKTDGMAGGTMPSQGLMSANHSRTMLRVGPMKRSKGR